LTVPSAMLNIAPYENALFVMDTVTV
jgi:hypothetical protein